MEAATDWREGPRPTFSELVSAFATIGVLSFGGPAAQIGLMHRIAVDEKRWISEERFLHALNYCMLLPGPEAQQLATYIGWLLHGVRGGMVAGLLFVLPGLAVILGLSTAYALYQDTTWLAGLFFGLKAAVLAIVVEAVIRIGRRALKSRFHRLVALVAFLSLFLLSVPFPLVVLLAGVAGFLAARAGPAVPAAIAEAFSPEDRRMPGGLLSGRSLFVLLFWVAVWQAPLLLLSTGALGGAFSAVFVFFSKMALVTFGGAYAVLAYVAQVAVETHHWLNPGEMLDGLALAETTPGPLVLVLSFVGFLAGYRDPGVVGAVPGGVLGALLAAWATFVPSFIWIFAGAPYIERLRGNRLLTGALSAITAAVVGVILNLAVWFALHVLFTEVRRFVFWRGFEGEGLDGASGFFSVAVSLPDPATLDPAALAVSLLSALLIFRFGVGIGRVLVVAAALGLALRFFIS
ncbi:chromate efflux transporter [Ciceribacter ferrooxidans]|uniref:Chromate efflux transporter n=1 Tax=Ciceribacter ferrooxidans TaxID=2509717 RepID=A0A4Q2S567_9HYPH|nr:chromate efflux transporter [Ciceribacter ferrooxidans]RYB97029.1 chromate efflux transporter [Ciceribacter ferrooxidans]